MVVVGGNGFGGQRREENGGRDDKEMEKKIEKVERVRIKNNKNKKKRNREIWFKWSGKRNRTFDIGCIVWCDKIDKVGF